MAPKTPSSSAGVFLDTILSPIKPYLTLVLVNKVSNIKNRTSTSWGGCEPAWKTVRVSLLDIHETHEMLDNPE